MEDAPEFKISLHIWVVASDMQNDTALWLKAHVNYTGESNEDYKLLKEFFFSMHYHHLQAVNCCLLLAFTDSFAR